MDLGDFFAPATTGGGDRRERRAGGLLEPRTVVPPGERGATRIADRVVAKVAARAAREAVGPLHPDAARPYATVAVHHDTARVRSTSNWTTRATSAPAAGRCVTKSCSGCAHWWAWRSRRSPSRWSGCT